MAKNNKATDYETPLRSWADLNEAMQSCEEDFAKALLEREKRGKQRKQFMLRIHSRINKLRADREREEILEVAGGGR